MQIRGGLSVGTVTEEGREGEREEGGRERERREKETERLWPDSDFCATY